MKRIDLFEFEDLSWFPSPLRNCMTRYLQVIHRILDSAPVIARLLDRILKKYPVHHIIDLCSGSGGPMLEVIELLQTQYRYSDLSITFSDLHPNKQAKAYFEKLDNPLISYNPRAVDVTNEIEDRGIRTLICSLHHMKIDIAISVLKNARDNAQPIFIYEISDNSFPKWLWWIVIPINIMGVLILTPLVRPLRWQQVVFTYLIPLLPLVIAWDGAVSNARTYTLRDLDQILANLHSEDYYWTKGKVPGRGGYKLYLYGAPKGHSFPSTV